MQKIKNLKRIIFNLFKILLDPQYYFKIAKSQHDNKENLFLENVSSYFSFKSFIEIGFHYNSYNCISLIKKDFDGVLIDAGSKMQILVMKIISQILKKKIKVKDIFIKKNNINKIIDGKNFGVISIDIDGNDFWILKEILINQTFPEMFIVEFNASFLDKSITIEYEDDFYRFNKHKTGWYHGASLCAIYKLLKQYDYHLVKTIGGVNAFFVNEKFLKKSGLKSFLPTDLYEESYLRNKWSSTTATQQFNTIKHLNFINI